MSRTAPDPYAVLGIPREATSEQVQRAYRRLAKRYHPDLHPDAQTNQQMRRVNRAWEALSTPASRARYDAESTLSKPARSEHWTSRPPGSGHWTAARASPSTGRSDPRRASMASDDGDSPGWRAVAGSMVLGLVLLVAIFSGVLPTPLFGLVLLIGARSILARFD